MLPLQNASNRAVIVATLATRCVAPPAAHHQQPMVTLGGTGQGEHGRKAGGRGQQLPAFDNSTPLDRIRPDCQRKGENHKTPLFIAVFMAFSVVPASGIEPLTSGL